MHILYESPVKCIVWYPFKISMLLKHACIFYYISYQWQGYFRIPGSVINNRTTAKNTLSFGFPPFRPKQHGSWLTVTKELPAHQATAICAGRLNTQVNASL